ncbi:MAG: hypothetical protein A3A94_01675 [Candidatus Portnoybacteria bacterium RIFCSPLOWO2_01_FULL_43_11]|uniref:Type 4 fimbrial biogenesis protein PilX N-terminal domain-containing protein n=4 Tax=Candidatus Portnoyibacteriota TaxID=1817913 RepID=A0A1G2FCP1_9BACT|nr:MAG: hypothetical protein A2815_00420 [Candidatus Portnoybacteria bacterium RIFCSPHIGHO2_01_FULL_40_12b]OGZ39175.1 MAG: hypothetical protein A3A94_01675 [Candidatus Portnoybacteria bacterium RIFCSPLOWO2_01_FULL_43_11]OGZ39189.1 MAG: hypothetical protein A3E90_01910 [Candidatus Portnoybacteria bacterium RIFCSPHIGHO2_12_FULL_40_11]OGZ39905.1 MAG: hypothetical protein A3I20_02830 [Candidatus Portnoybacteria bacterium RIFCSPLOWO2_02_FULL_40_15]
MKNKGFILIYAIIITGILAIIVGIAVNSILSELKISRDESESLKAFYAADAAIECVEYYQNNNSAFDTMSPNRNYDCGVGNFRAGLGRAGDCINHTYNFTLNGFSNGSCVNVEVIVVPKEIFIGGNPVFVCDFEVISMGRNSCSALGASLVERVRWEDM